MITKQLKNAAQIAVEQYLTLDPNEAFLVVYDENMKLIAQAIRNAGAEITDRVFFLEIPGMEINGDEPPNQLIDIMRSVDVVACVTSKSITHTGPRHQATKGGVRVATIPEMSAEAFIRNISADRSQIENLNDILKEILEEAEMVKVTTQAGTDISFQMPGRKIKTSSGRFNTLGAWGNLPSGEVYAAPIEEETMGRLVVDGTIAEVGLITSPVTIEISDGVIEDIDGKGQPTMKFKKLMASLTDEGNILGEFGIGTNHKAQLSGDIAEDEKVLGTCHFGFGNNFSFGGSLTPASHIDCVILKPTIEVDGRIIMEEGKFTLEENED